MTKDERVTALVHSLCNVDVVVVDELRSSFVLKASGEDVTRESKGSDRLVVRAANDSALYLAPKNPALRMPLLCETINHFLLGAVQNLQPLSTMLTCSVDDIDTLLTFHHITAPTGGFSDHLGLPISADEELRLDIVTAAHQLVPGADIGWMSEDGSARILYGRVSNVHSESEAEVEVSPSESKTLPFAQLRLILSVADANVRGEERRAEEAARQKQILEADKVLFDGFADIVPNLDEDDQDSVGKFAQDGQPHSATAEDEKIIAQARADPIRRVEYTPPDQQWQQKEESLLDKLKARDEGMKKMLEPEPPGIDDVLAANGFASPAASEEDRLLAAKTNVSVGTQRRGGYDLVRWGNIRECAYFHYRPDIENFTADAAAQDFASKCVDVLEEVSAVFEYDPACEWYATA